MTSLEQIARLEKGWNHDRADPIDKADIELVRQILERLEKNGYAMPTVCPAPEGGIDLEWPDFELYVSNEDLFVQFGAPDWANKQIALDKDKGSFAYGVIVGLLVSCYWR